MKVKTLTATRATARPGSTTAFGQRPGHAASGFTSAGQAHRTRDDLDDAAELLERSGATTEQAEKIRELLYLGFTLDVASRSAREHDEGLADVLTAFCMASRAAAKGKPFSLSLVAPEPTPTAKPGHFPWCEDCDTHTDDAGILTEHAGAKVKVQAPEHMSVGKTLLSASLYASDEYIGGTRLSISCRGEGTVLSPDETDELIGDLAKFLKGLRNLRRQMGQPQAAAE